MKRDDETPLPIDLPHDIFPDIEDDLEDNVMRNKFIHRCATIICGVYVISSAVDVLLHDWSTPGIIGGITLFVAGSLILIYYRN